MLNLRWEISDRLYQHCNFVFYVMLILNLNEIKHLSLNTELTVFVYIQTSYNQKDRRNTTSHNYTYVVKRLRNDNRHFFALNTQDNYLTFGNHNICMQSNIKMCALACAFLSPIMHYFHFTFRVQNLHNRNTDFIHQKHLHEEKFFAQNRLVNTKTIKNLAINSPLHLSFCLFVLPFL